MLAKDRLIVALDGMNPSAALDIAKTLSGRVWGFKVNDLLLEVGIPIVSELKRYGRVFADPKLHDIPNTVAHGVRRLESAGADLITVHASGGTAMLQAAVSTAESAQVLAVTALTSLTQEECARVYALPPDRAVLSLGALAIECGVHGLVCSPHELTLLQPLVEKRAFLRVTPGIRPPWHRGKDDQARVATPREALANGASLLVIGRPITQHPSPLEALEVIETDLS